MDGSAASARARRSGRGSREDRANARPAAPADTRWRPRGRCRRRRTSRLRRRGSATSPSRAASATANDADEEGSCPAGAAQQRHRRRTSRPGEPEAPSSAYPSTCGSQTGEERRQLGAEATAGRSDEEPGGDREQPDGGQRDCSVRMPGAFIGRPCSQRLGHLRSAIDSCGTEGAIDVILPVLDEAAAIPQVLAAFPERYRPIVVDNGSSDGSDELAARLGAEVVGEPRRGFGAACFAGAERGALRRRLLHGLRRLARPRGAAARQPTRSRPAPPTSSSVRGSPSRAPGLSMPGSATACWR